MINKAEFNKLRRQMKESDEKRETAIAQSREIVRTSKRAIYAVHRRDIVAARNLMPKMEEQLATLKKIKDPNAASQLRIAEQEYVEAACFLGFVTKRTLTAATELKVQPEHYLLGLCDLAGEISRYALNSAIQGDANAAKDANMFLSDLYGELLGFDFRNGELRKKFDGVKYELKKLEELEFELSRR